LLAIIPAQAGPILQVSGGILDGIDGVVVDGSTYNVTFVQGSCVSVFSGCTSTSDFPFGASGTEDATSALESILSGGIVNASFPNGIVNEAFVGAANAYDDLFTPYAVSNGLVTGYYTNVDVGAAQVPLTYGVQSASSYGTNYGLAYAAWASAPASVPEPSSLMLMSVGMASLAGMIRRKVKA
jgi:hypothetical protein